MSPFQLALSNLLHQRFRTLISVIGVGFAVLLIFMQIGFRDAVTRTATLLYDKLNFDLILMSSEYGNLARADSFSRDRIALTREVAGVTSVEPITTTLGLWRDPSTITSDGNNLRKENSILILALKPEQIEQVILPDKGVFNSPDEMIAASVRLRRVGTVLIDRSSRAEYGNAKTWTPFTRNELNRQTIEVTGTFRIGTGFAYNGLLMTSEETLSNVVGWPSNRVSFGLIRKAQDVDAEKLREALEKVLPGDVQIRTRKQIIADEQNYWLTGTPVGIFFTAGVFIAFLVGGIFVYQMMASDINKNLPEYATIKALGYQGHFLSRVVYYQGMLLALIGFIPGFLITLLCYEITRRNAGIPITMTFPRIGGVLLLTVLMCMGSAVAAVRIVHRANPADLF